MSWTDYTTPVIMVETGEAEGKTRPVRGLGLDDMTQLVVEHLDDMMEITTLYIQSMKDVSAVTNFTDLLTVAAKTFPDLVMEVISIVTDTPEMKDKRLGAALQMKVLSAAFKLTVEDAGGMGNLSAMLEKIVRAALANRGEVSQKLGAILSSSSIGDAEKTPTS